MIGPAHTTRLRIVRTRRDYNRWVADETLEDYALRFTAKKARIWSPMRVANTAMGSLSFLALEAIGGTLTLAYGVTNTMAAIAAVVLVIFAISVPICVAAARYGVDIDLLTRGAGFGYIGSTVTSLIYAIFTFLFFGIEAAILAAMLHGFFQWPLWLAYLVCAAAVIPFVTYGVTFLTRFQLWTQPLWIVLNALPLAGLAIWHPGWLSGWRSFTGIAAAHPGFAITQFGMAVSTIFVLICQTAEQVDFIRFMPPPRPGGRIAWWAGLLLGGPAWIVVDAVKLVAGSLLAYAALHLGLNAAQAVQPAEMYRLAYGSFLPPLPALLLTCALVALCQTKINVTNAYSGSLAWSNFFSRLTHSHPGRLFYVFFNIAIALVVMETGILDTIQSGLVLYADLAAAWIGAVVADLVINKPLRLSPRGIEFKRAHLPDINPVGVGAMATGAIVGVVCYAGVLGPVPAAFSTFIAFGAAFVTAPAIASATRGRTYLARKPRASWAARGEITCTLCEHPFEPEDMAHCPAYGGAICSLCCSLDARCGDSCKPPQTQLAVQVAMPLLLLPRPVQAALGTRVARFVLFMLLLNGMVIALLTGLNLKIFSMPAFIWLVLRPEHPGALLVMFLVSAVISWMLVLGLDNRRAAVEETARQTRLLMNEIRAHRRTDAELQKAKEKAEAASIAKSRYVGGISHELRSPLNAILGYAQLMEADAGLPDGRRHAVRIIRESGQHLTAIIAGLLDIAKIEAGRIDIFRERVRLPELMDGVVQMMRPQAEAKGLQFSYERFRLPRMVHADEHRLRQILINLLSNAIKFTRTGEIRLTASWRNQIARFEVADTGPGIAAADLDRIFEPFVRVTEDAAAPGTGLGLTITRLLTEILGGELTVTSVPGQGSCFTARLMLSDTVDDAASHAISQVAGYTGLRRRVLVVDDNPTHRALMHDILAPLGFHLRAVPDAASCLTLIDAWLPDLFLLDLTMPGMDGRELALRLREVPAGQAPIIFVSANAHDLAVAQQPGLSDCGTLSKPLEVALLLEEIGRRMDINWVKVEAPATPRAEPAPPVAFAMRPRLSDLQRGRLRAFLEAGDVRGTRQLIDALEQDDAGLKDILHPLRELARAYRLDALLQRLRPEAGE